MNQAETPAGRDLKLHRSKDRSIASILVAAGRITPETEQSISKRQQETGGEFSETAKAMGLISQADLTFALSRQFEYPYPILKSSAVSREVTAGYHPFSRQIEALRGVRSRLLLNWLRDGAAGQTLAIVSPARGEGRSWLTANLGVLFSQLGERTLIIDADLRNPRQHSLFGLLNHGGLSNVIAGLAGLEVINQSKEFSNLSVMTAGTTPPNPQELISRVEFGLLLQRLREEFDVILIDTPALAEVADAEAIAARAGSVLFVARKNFSKLAQLDQCCSVLQRYNVEITGSVLLD